LEEGQNFLLLPAVAASLGRTGQREVRVPESTPDRSILGKADIVSVGAEPKHAAFLSLR